MNAKKISVIIAAYNADVYLKESMDSITLQSMKQEDYEIIVVDDGSTDRTGQILEEYAARYDNIQVIHKENGGPAEARNVGLDHAQGQYIYFFDADDIVLPEALEQMYQKIEAEKADLLIAKYNYYDDNRIRPNRNLEPLIALGNIPKYTVDLLWTFSLWNKLYKRDIIEENGIRFPKLNYSEDGVFYIRYLSWCKKIVSLDEYVLHYRKSFMEHHEGITATISPAKIDHYIKSHRIMAETIKESSLKDYPEYATFEDAVSANTKVHGFIDAFYRKEIEILLKQFYVKFWTLPMDTRKLIYDEIQTCLAQMSMKEIFTLLDEFPEYDLYNIPLTDEQALNQSLMTVPLYGDENNKEQFLRCLFSLEDQTLIFLKIYLPSHMKNAVEQAGYGRANLIYVDCDSQAALFQYAKEHVDTKYILFADPMLYYFKRGFNYETKKLSASLNDFISSVVYHRDYGEVQPTVCSKIATDSLGPCFRYNEELYFDAILGNKFFKSTYIKNLELDFRNDILDIQKKIYSTAYYNHRYSKAIFFEGSEQDYIKYLTKPETKEQIEKHFEKKEISLTDEEFLYDPAKSGHRFIDWESEKKERKLLEKIVIPFAQKLPLRKRVAFVSIRSDGSLDTNAKALYDAVKSKKVFYSHKLPHSRKDIHHMMTLIQSSKVIVTDDYVKYLRYFPIRPEQRVIQLWHACGVFKKFGIRGTNIKLDVDRASHAQYNLMCVSGENVRQIYADAFDISFDKVRALGVPRTDAFFDENYIKERKEKIYAKYPDFRDKEVIIYAPTFRDVGKDRSKFQPDLDFERLSKELLPNQIFLICPHPLMKNAIVDKDYPNIKVIRDFSTNDMMFVSDMMVTDYSSVIFEYALLKKPIVFFCYDLKIYNRGFYLKYPEDLPGEVYDKQEDLFAYLKDAGRHKTTDKLEAFIDKYMGACDGHSSERIAKIIDAYVSE